MLRLHDVLSRHDRIVLSAAGGILVLSLPIAALLTSLDMSFRPLFAHQPDIAAATAGFESRFGQSSGSQVALILHRDGGLDDGFRVDLSRLAAALRTLPGVVEVLRPTDADLTAAPQAGDLSANPRAADLSANPRAADLGTNPRAADLGSNPQAADVGANPRGADFGANARAAPKKGTSLVAEGGRHVLLLARLDIPLDQLGARRAAIREIRRTADAWRPADVRISYTGVSVVEAAYADAIPAGLAVSLLLTTGAVVLLLFGVFRHPGMVAAALAGVTVATPLTIAGLALSGRPLTMLSSMAPTVILIVGVADAIHMLRRWRREAETEADGAVRRMIAAMALPCALTTLTTAAGFLALTTARIGAIREFGITAAAGVMIVFAANIVLVPALLNALGVRPPATGTGHRAAPSGTGRRPGRLLRAALAGTRSPRASVAIGAILCAAALAGIPRMVVDQRFNEELPASHPAVAGQALLEREFGGFLGPDIEVGRVDGRSILDADALARLALLQTQISRMEGVDAVTSVLALLPADAAGAAARSSIESLRADSLMLFAVREHIHGSERTALRVRTGDIGTRAALALVDSITASSQRVFGGSYEVRIVGQWWLAQLGTASLLRDMLVSFATSVLLVLPMLALALRSPRMLLIALPANLLPMLAALAFMGWTGMTLRVGTALVLAIALAIAVDDTIHLLARTHEERLRGVPPRRAMRTALLECTPALAATTLVLVAGFASMLGSQIAAIRDMGLVAAVALATALAADVLILPPLYLLFHASTHRLRTRRRPSTSFARSSRSGRSSRFMNERPVAVARRSGG